jgi:hypothetical protein
MPRVGDIAKLHSSDLVVCVTGVDRDTQLLTCFYWINEGDNRGPCVLEGIHENCFSDFKSNPLMREPILSGDLVELVGHESSPILYANTDGKSPLSDMQVIWHAEEGELISVDIPTMALKRARNQHA